MPTSTATRPGPSTCPATVQSRPGTVEVRAHSQDEKVVVVVADEGRGMLPRTDSPGLGLGLPLIAQMTQSLEVHDRQGGGTEIRMSFALDATA